MRFGIDTIGIDKFVERVYQVFIDCGYQVFVDCGYQVFVDH